MSMPKHNIPADKLALYDKLIATNPKIKRKGTANPYTSLNGHMFTYLNPSGSLDLRLPEDARENSYLIALRQSCPLGHNHQGARNDSMSGLLHGLT